MVVHEGPQLGRHHLLLVRGDAGRPGILRAIRALRRAHSSSGVRGSGATSRMTYRRHHSVTWRAITSMASGSRSTTWWLELGPDEGPDVDPPHPGRTAIWPWAWSWT